MRKRREEKKNENEKKQKLRRSASTRNVRRKGNDKSEKRIDGKKKNEMNVDVRRTAPKQGEKRGIVRMRRSGIESVMKGREKETKTTGVLGARTRRTGTRAATGRTGVHATDRGSDPGSARAPRGAAPGSARAAKTGGSSDAPGTGPEMRDKTGPPSEKPRRMAKHGVRGR